MAVFKINDLSFSYPNSEKKALKNINLEIEEGDFVLLCGKSGCGKSTLLSMLKPELTPNGEKNGEVLFFNKGKLTLEESARKIGFMLQNAEYQTVTHSVLSELSFGLENIGCSTSKIKQKIAEVCAEFSLDNILNKKVDELSGGQKQLLCLASIAAMTPKAIILDEPTSQLDPVTASSFLSILKTLSTDNGITVVISEHRLQNVVPLSDRVILMEDGEIISNTSVLNIYAKHLMENEFFNASMPFYMLLYANFPNGEKMPLSIYEGKKWLSSLLKNKLKYTSSIIEDTVLSNNNAVEMKNVFYSYDSKNYVLRNMSLKIKEGSFVSLMGANGAGKTTALSLMSGILECKSGKIKIFGKDIRKYNDAHFYGNTVAYLPQKCESLFAGNTIKEDMQYLLKASGMKKDEALKKIEEISAFCEISHILNSHPYDVSGGEMQKAALALILLKEPKIIFLDEPTKGMDNLFKKRFGEKIKALCKSGITAVMVSHDTEFCAEYCDECVMIFNGECVSKENKYDFFCENIFYTTSARKISRDIFENAVTQRQVVELCKKNLLS